MLRSERPNMELTEEQRKRSLFWETLKEDDKVEFINGHVVMRLPVTLAHNTVSSALAMLIGVFADTYDLGATGHARLMISLSRNDYEPDVCFWRKERAADFKPDQLRFPTPDFIAEVLSESTASTDRGVKFEDYAAHGMTEYWIIDPDAQTVEQYLLDGEQYKLAVKTDVASNATLKSAAIPGFAIPARALFDSAERQRALRELLG